MDPASWITVAIFSLAWFVVGLLCGNLLPPFLRRAVATLGRRPGKDADDEGQESRGQVEGVEIYVGNLAYSVTKTDLEQAFGKFGKIGEIRLIRNRITGKSRGYGFVVMPERRAATAAVKALNGADFCGRPMVANEAKSRPRE
jgi:RNA recognition motif-containing protein